MYLLRRENRDLLTVPALHSLEGFWQRFDAAHWPDGNFHRGYSAFPQSEVSSEIGIRCLEVMKGEFRRNDTKTISRPVVVNDVGLVYGSKSKDGTYDGVLGLIQSRVIEVTYNHFSLRCGSPTERGFSFGLKDSHSYRKLIYSPRLRYRVRKGSSTSTITPKSSLKASDF